MSGIIPYLLHYRTAFAFSDILYPLIYRLTLRLAFHTEMEIVGLTLIPLILHNGLASVYSPGESWITLGDTRTPKPYPLPFWSRPISIFGLSTLTAFINSSHVLRIPSFLAPNRLDAARVELASRLALQVIRPRASLSPGLHTKPLPVMHAGVRNCR